MSGVFPPMPTSSEPRPGFTEGRNQCRSKYHDQLSHTLDRAAIFDRDRIMELKTAEEQAQALLELDFLLGTKAGTALAKKLAGPSGRGCQRLAAILEDRGAERARKKAERARKKALVKPERFVMPSLFDSFATPPPPEVVDEETRAPEVIDEEPHGGEK
jgi:hypothetical protein